MQHCPAASNTASEIQIDEIAGRPCRFQPSIERNWAIERFNEEEWAGTISNFLFDGKY